VQNTKPKIITIVGPTASGKSALAIEIAKNIGGEIISADSRQVYKELNILSGKVTKKKTAGIPHHLLSVCSVKKVFSVAQYKQLAQDAIQSVLRKNKVPILCGGTGFYLQAIIDNILLPEVEANQTLRAKLQKKSAAQLFSLLKKKDPVRAKNIDGENKIRLTRALEIVHVLGKVPAIQSNPQYNALQIGIRIDPEKLRANITKRLVSRMKSGMLAEIKKMYSQGIRFKRLKELGLECRYLTLFLEKKMSKKEMLSKLEIEIFQYAKRQMTWFKKDKRIEWYALSEKKKLHETIKNFLS